MAIPENTRQEPSAHTLPDSAEPDGWPTGERRAEGGAEQGDRDDRAGLRRADPEAVLDAGDRAVDHGAVVAEEESAERGRGRQERDPAQNPVRRLCRAPADRGGNGVGGHAGAPFGFGARREAGRVR
jgi:hypothetical protein